MTAENPTIFVQIASYRDPETQWTVRDLFEKAQRPDNIHVGICWQCDMEQDAECFVIPSPRPLQTKITSVLPHESLGVCWARAETQKFFKDEDYVLMIDSHMRFIQNWDTELIAELKRCGSPKSFLSTYPPGYKPPHNLEPNPKPIVMRAKPFNDQGDIRFEGEVLVRTPEKPLRGAFLAAGLLFAPGSFVREVPYDPHLYFNQEEINLATRAFTHGWDVYAPTKAFVYHYYNEPQKGETRKLHWHDKRDWADLEDLSRQRARYLLAGEQPRDREALEEIDRFQMGRARSIAEYEEFTGIDFKHKTVSDKGRRSGFIEGLDKYRAGAAPEAGFRALKAGDVLPATPLKDANGMVHQLPVAAGGPLVICALPHAFDDYARGFMEQYKARRAALDAAGIPVVFATPIGFAEIAAYEKRNGVPGLLADEEHILHRSFGLGARSYDSPVTIVLAGNIVRAVYDNRNPQNHMGDVSRAPELLKIPSP